MDSLDLDSVVNNFKCVFKQQYMRRIAKSCRATACNVTCAQCVHVDILLELT